MKQGSKKKFFAKHAKSSAALVSLGIHGILLVVALSFVAVTVITKDGQSFEAKPVNRPKVQLKKLQVPVKIQKPKPKPKLRKRVVVKNVQHKTPEFKMPEITGIKGGVGSVGAGGFGDGSSIGFSMPEIDFFGAKAKGEKVAVVVHFGPATIGITPLERMTGYIIRKRVEDLVNGLPEYTLFNVACYWKSDTWAMHPKLLQATPANKQMVADWMAPVNPLKGDYNHCFSVSGKVERNIERARESYPERVEKGLPFYSPKWIYPYVVPAVQTQKYLPGTTDGYVHWSRGVSWAVLEQKADTIFILTTNYIDGFGGRDNGRPEAMLRSYKTMFADVYGPDKNKWPTINVVVLKHGKDPDEVLNAHFGPVWKGTKGDGSVIHDITKFMNDGEKELYRQLAGGADASSVNISDYVETADTEPRAAGNESAPQGKGQPSVASGEPRLDSPYPVDPILGIWQFKFEGARKHTTREFTATGLCIQRNQRGKKEWECSFSMTSVNSATTVRDDMLHELQTDGTLHFQGNVIATRVD